MKRTILRAVPCHLALFAALILGGMALPAGATSAADTLAGPVNLQLADADLGQVLTSFAKIVGAEADLGSKVQGLVTIDLHKVPAAEALDGICQTHACNWWVIERPGQTPLLRVRHAGDAIQMDLQNADLRKTLQAFGKVLDMPVEIDPSLQGSVSLKAERKPWSWLLNDICDDAGCRWTLDEEADVLRVTANP